MVLTFTLHQAGGLKTPGAHIDSIHFANDLPSIPLMEMCTQLTKIRPRYLMSKCVSESTGCLPLAPLKLTIEMRIIPKTNLKGDIEDTFIGLG
jgi:hypothetical protein